MKNNEGKKQNQIILSGKKMATILLVMILCVSNIFIVRVKAQENAKEAIINFTNKYFATVITLFFGFLLCLGGYNNIWPLFGAANQLLASLVLIALSVFLLTTGRKGWMLYAPMCIMLVVTFTALVQSVIGIFTKIFVTGGFVFMIDGLQLIVALLLMALGLMVAISCFKKLFQKSHEGSSNSSTHATV